MSNAFKGYFALVELESVYTGDVYEYFRSYGTKARGLTVSALMGIFIDDMLTARQFQSEN